MLKMWQNGEDKIRKKSSKKHQEGVDLIPDDLRKLKLHD